MMRANTKETKSHFDFGLFGNLNGSEYSDEDGKKFAVAYYREDLKAMDCNPDIYAQQNENKDNPHKTKHVDECMKALGHSGNYYSSNDEVQVWQKLLMTNTILMSLEHLIVRSRAIACTKDEYNNLKLGELQKVIQLLNIKHGLIQFKNNAIN